MSDYTVRRLQTREQLDAVVEVIFKAQYSPYMPSSSIFFPVAGYSLEERSVGVAASKERLWKEHLAANPATNHWIIVEEKESLKIVGGCLWKWHDENPFPDGIPTPSVYWWPEGEAREFCEEMIRQSMTPRSLWMHDKNAGQLSYYLIISSFTLNSLLSRTIHDGRAPRSQVSWCWWTDDGMGQY